MNEEQARNTGKIISILSIFFFGAVTFLTMCASGQL